MASCLILFALVAPSAFQETLKTHRVHLTNGNVIDGILVESTSERIGIHIDKGTVWIDFVRIRAIERLSSPYVDPPPQPVHDPIPVPAPDPPQPPPASLLPEEDRQSLESFLAVLDKAKPVEQRRMASKAAELGVPAGGYLAARLEALDPTGQSWVFDVLARIQHKDLMPVVRGLFSSRHEFVRARAVGLIDAREDAGTLPRIVELANDPAPSVRLAAFTALDTLGDRHTLALIAGGVADRDPQARARAAETCFRLAERYGQRRDLVRRWSDFSRPLPDESKILVAAYFGRLGPPPGVPRDHPDFDVPRSVERLIRWLGDRSPEVRRACAGSLAVLEAREAVPDLLEALERELDPATQAAFALAFERLGDRRAVRPLVAMLRSPDEAVKASAAAALRKITGQPFGTNARAWEEFLDRFSE